MPVFPELLSDGPVSDTSAMRLAIAAAQRVRGTTRPNPAVGCVLLDGAGVPIAVAGTDPAGGLHAEAQAVRAAGGRADGGTAVVTLEPCNHQGRTPPCTGALLSSGVRRVVYALADPNPLAAGGADELRQHGIAVTGGVLADIVADEVLRAWLHTNRTGRPHITLKTATTIDGLAAATDGTSQWITGQAARDHVHVDRARRDAIVVGTGTVLADNPRLTARDRGGVAVPHQPARIVVGRSEVATDALIRGGADEDFRVVGAGGMCQLFTRDIGEVVGKLGELGFVDVLVEGGPRLAGAFVAAGCVDAIEAYIAPAVLGAGSAAVQVGAQTTIGDLRRFRTTSVTQLGNDVLLRAVRHAAS
ncbi:bifunctional diaminohydroxyphosphoribosylaminopyrimidine deaminase/5-amino-6-(5-phosphoribosylamino)uracil reductase RibD [Corynebacterium sp. TAE3-ERU12]|uniref:bifunctional diaminohydroxyphosphoribosylaminopyrimidine deaminase/5-amino-6-(5-phosphoribosylamino)uracil reductase RibD n=1 Tax=Corynebacterium sp. TAE3-ERU12 TaxID=2849491 RepID=UPI001C471F16|nr:bifunctional diaminohydroxyphosphoribosylaminopyrimidine deaminase/5-amino-6-(5-phosphoribosylamino)uracil reductase RibD [Corynebacterium sp. TAE3-ERU12]MBV7295399.1 bifunctional diaminohydroxyphosphoribosylaminopyrimidine deaminase/5-amino-6-(5-phosphoribosylamino)uracil reductase RibD [Corynebacterium sp. TAE3-ERU12]